MCVLLLFAAWVFSDLKRGDVDPVSALLGTVALIATLAIAVADRRQSERDPDAVAHVVARLVLKSEGDAWLKAQAGRPASIDLRFVLRSTPGQPSEGAAVEGRLDTIEEYYLALRRRRLVITGGPGAGKTVLMQRLLLDLCKNRTGGQPVPIRLSLSAWTELEVDDDAAHTSEPLTEMVRAWLIRTLINTYGISRRSADALLDAGQVLPMFDGLDEMDGTTRTRPAYERRARQALSALGRYAPNGTPSPMVLTCRADTYRDLRDVHVELDFAACVEIAALSPEQVRQFIAERSTQLTRWDGVLDQIDHHASGSLAQHLSAPWRLAIATQVYEFRDRQGRFLHDPNELLRLTLADPRGWVGHLHRLFVERALADPVWRNRGDAQRIGLWLGNIARYLLDNATTARTLGERVLPTSDIVPHELWPMGDAAKIMRWHRVLAFVSVLAVSAATAVTVGPAPAWQAALVVGPLFWLALGRLGSRVWPIVVLTHRRSVRHMIAGVLFAGVTGAVPYIVFGFDPVVAVALLGGVALWVGGRTRILDAETVVSPTGVISRSISHAVTSAAFSGALLGLVCGWAYGFYRGTTMVYAFGGVFGFATFMASADLGIRRLALHATTRMLPWRVSSDLSRAELCGLLRIAGDVYQFRHRELQDWFADQHNTL
ncbi:NACHT domain-containing protein [Streptomyces sp. NPDC102274]|uniref:NACHT domain-containing protein n=1 Tax=Streptomyces sp. NPDC102274 TaxID=3366151 RepID=UPI00381654E0